MPWSHTMVELVIPLWKTHETQDIDNDSKDNFQEENIIQQLICKME